MIAVTATAAIAITALAVALLAYPQPLFAHSMTHGQLELWSDVPFDEGHAKRVLDDAVERINTSPLPLDGATHRVFITNTEWRRRLFFLPNWQAGGINHYLARNVFIGRADIPNNRLSGDHGLVLPPRTLAYFIAHEIGHSLVGGRIGLVGNKLLPTWIGEGVPDYIGFGGDVDIDELTRALVDDKPEMNPAKSGLYARYRLLVAFMLKQEGWSIDRLLTSGLPLGEAEAILRKQMGARPAT
ncbi:MAG: hypothetical protein A4S14_13995 [Proteobacteria bacterium SG_bin9]|nr:MAG: hypothetical protein A4S14_13995 [Proteobacteria bacterium SG_bin9]